MTSLKMDQRDEDGNEGISEKSCIVGLTRINLQSIYYTGKASFVSTEG